jgi:hypothetical protein
MIPAQLELVEEVGLTSRDFDSPWRDHGITWDPSKSRFVVRLTVDLGPRLSARRISIPLRTKSPRIARLNRDAIFDTLRALGLTIRTRNPRR